jgi:hypothetical protein
MRRAEMTDERPIFTPLAPRMAAYISSTATFQPPSPSRSWAALESTPLPQSGPPYFRAPAVIETITQAGGASTAIPAAIALPKP